MSFFDKIIDLFLGNKITKKDLKEPKRLNFNKFGSKYEEIKKQAKSKSDIVANDTKKKLFSKKLFQFVEDEIDTTEKNTEILFRQSNSKQFSTTMAKMIRYMRVYALYYMYGEKSRTPKEALRVYDRLKDVYDLTVFAVLRYFNHERGELVVWHGDQNKFLYHNDEKEDVLFTAVDLLSTNNALVDAIVHNDSSKVYEILNEKLNVSKVGALEADDIFEL